MWNWRQSFMSFLVRARSSMIGHRGYRTIRRPLVCIKARAANVVAASLMKGPVSDDKRLELVMFHFCKLPCRF